MVAFGLDKRVRDLDNMINEYFQTVDQGYFNGLVSLEKFTNAFSDSANKVALNMILDQVKICLSLCH